RMGKRMRGVGGSTRQVNPTPWPDARLDRLTSLSRRLVIVAAVATSERLETQQRYAEEFDSTLQGITGQFAPLKRLRCAISILIGAPTIQMENEELEPDR